MSDTVEKLLDAAEMRMRAAGYNAVSFRDIAADIGVKSASVHYHFATKEALGIALVQRYRSRFLEGFQSAIADLDNPKAKLAVFINMHRSAFKIGESICLCGMLGAEASGLPPKVTAEVGAAFKGFIEALTDVFCEAGHIAPESAAMQIVSGLEGAMIVATSLQDQSVFEDQADIFLTFL